jgi:hypothetical protein
MSSGSIQRTGSMGEPLLSVRNDKTPKLLTESMIRRKSPRIDVRDAGEMLMRSVSLVYSRRQPPGSGKEEKKPEENDDDAKRKEALKKSQDKMKKYVENDIPTVLNLLNVSAEMVTHVRSRPHSCSVRSVHALISCLYVCVSPAAARGAACLGLLLCVCVCVFRV